MKIKDLFEQGLTSESTIHEMIELLASLKEETGPEASNKREFNKVHKQHARGWESRSTSAEHVKVHDAGGHTIFHHGDSDGLDHGFVGKHPEGHSSTSIDLGYESSSHDIEKEVAKQNPHLSPETHKLLARHIHKQVMTNESVDHTTSNRSQSPLIEATVTTMSKMYNYIPSPRLSEDIDVKAAELVDRISELQEQLQDLEESSSIYQTSRSSWKDKSSGGLSGEEKKAVSHHEDMSRRHSAMAQYHNDQVEKSRDKEGSPSKQGKDHYALGNQHLTASMQHSVAAEHIRWKGLDKAGPQKKVASAKLASEKAAKSDAKRPGIAKKL